MRSRRRYLFDGDWLLYFFDIRDTRHVCSIAQVARGTRAAYNADTAMETKAFQKMILGWYKKNGRHTLPWRSEHTPDPYHIFVSEIMLQQTQVDRVIPKYQHFLKTFPTLKSLADASVASLLGEWKGLGYNRRALNMQRAARAIVRTHGGVFPSDPETLEELPGIGPYTARAIAVFAFNEPHVFIETNIRRIYIHFFFQTSKKVSDIEIMPLVERTLYKKDPRVWYSALMDYGAGPLRQVPNPNKRSKHYTKQSRFEGSRRYARAKLVDHMVGIKKLQSLADIEKKFAHDQLLARHKEQFVDILHDLEEEGFLVRTGNRWKIR